MIRTRDDAHAEMLRQINYAVDEASSAERAIAHATVANALCNMLDRLPSDTPIRFTSTVPGSQ